jgi:hypothetical protein
MTCALKMRRHLPLILTLMNAMAAWQMLGRYFSEKMGNNIYFLPFNCLKKLCVCSDMSDINAFFFECGMK